MLKYPSPVSIKDKDYSPKLNQDYYIEEKIDGSQLSVGFIDDVITFQCRGKDISSEQKCFSKSVVMLKYNQDKLNKNYIYYGESLTSNKHNIITYSRMPLFNFMIYDIYDRVNGTFLWYTDIHEECKRIGYEHVPFIMAGNGPYISKVKDMVENMTSFLGGVCEGVVVKFRVRDRQTNIERLKDNKHRKTMNDERQTNTLKDS